MKLAFLIALLLTGCTASSQLPEPLPKPNPVDPSKKMSLRMFGAFSCSICNEELPELQKYLESKFGDKLALVDFQVFVVDANSQERAKEYGKALGLWFGMAPDYRCRGEYQKYWGGSGCSVPATVALDASGSVVRNFGKGRPSFDAVASVIAREIEK